MSFGLKIIKQPWFIGPITQGLVLALEASGDLGQKLAQLEESSHAGLDGQQVLLLPAPKTEERYSNPSFC